MKAIHAGRVFRVDYSDLKQVKRLADLMGKGHVVVKHPDRPNYNITHADRTDLYKKEWVVYRP